MSLSVANHSSGFVQQGTVDWVALARAPVTFSVDALARYSTAGIDVLTVTTGQRAFSSIALPSTVESNILDQLSKLPCVSFYGKVAWFGFGLRHVLYDLIDKEGGLAYLAICGCLGQSYDSFLGAQVLRAFCQCLDLPIDLQPGLQCWQALLKPCAGIFMTTKFTHLIYGFTRLLAPWAQDGIEQYEATKAESLA